MQHALATRTPSGRALGSGSAGGAPLVAVPPTSNIPCAAVLRRAASASAPSGRRLSVGGPAARAAAGGNAGGSSSNSWLPLPPPFDPQQQQQQTRRQSQQPSEQQQQPQQHSTAPPVSSADASFDETDHHPSHPLPPRNAGSGTARAPSLLHEEDLQRFFFAQQAEAAAAEAEGRAHHHLVRPASPVPPFERPSAQAAQVAATTTTPEQQQQRRQRRSTTSTSPIDSNHPPPLNHAYYVQATPIPRAINAAAQADGGDAALLADDASAQSSRNSNSSSVAPPMHVTVFTEAEMDAVSAAAIASGVQPPAFDLACDVTTPKPWLPPHLQRTTFTVVARRDYADVFLGATGRELVNGLRGSQVPCYGWRCGAAEASAVALPLAGAAGGGDNDDSSNGSNLGRLWRRGDAVELVLEPESPRSRGGREGEEEEDHEGDADGDGDNDDNAEGRTMSLLLRVNGREVDRLHGIPASTLTSSNKSSAAAPVWYVGLYASSAGLDGNGGAGGGNGGAADLAAIMFESSSSHSVAWGDFRVQRYT